MIKKCDACDYIGELIYRNGKYYCTMCGSEVTENAPDTQGQPQAQALVNDVSCPICKNREKNLFDGKKYYCALCGAPFMPQQNEQTSNYGQSAGASNSNYLPYVQNLKKEKRKNIGLGILFVFLFCLVCFAEEIDRYRPK